jgi:hypothetical protein
MGEWRAIAACVGLARRSHNGASPHVPAPDQGIERISLLRVADEALYSAKQGGRNRVAHLGGSAASSEEPASRKASRKTA